MTKCADCNDKALLNMVWNKLKYITSTKYCTKCFRKRYLVIHPANKKYKRKTNDERDARDRRLNA